MSAASRCRRELGLASTTGGCEPWPAVSLGGSVALKTVIRRVHQSTGHPGQLATNPHLDHYYYNLIERASIHNLIEVTNIRDNRARSGTARIMVKTWVGRVAS
jgi:hypothetical protein